MTESENATAAADIAAIDAELREHGDRHRPSGGGSGTAEYRRCSGHWTPFGPIFTAARGY